MNKIMLTTDSGICAIKKDSSIVIPAQVVASDGKNYADNGQLTNKKILTDMNNGIIYKTASPLLGDYETVFRNILEQGDDVIHVSMSSGISAGSVNSANLIANNLNSEYKNQVYVIDSLTGATGGTLFYELAYQEIINSSKSPEAIVEKLNDLRKQIATSFYVPNVDGYIRSGRDKTSSHIKNNILSATSQLAKRALFKFRVDFHESGDLYLKKVFRSSEQKGMEKMVMDIVNDKTIQNYDPEMVVVGSLYKDKVDLENVKKYLSSFKYFKRILEKDIGSVVAAYGCNDLCGISLIKKKK